MAAVAPPSDRTLSSPNSLEAAELLQKLSLDSQNNNKPLQPPTDHPSSANKISAAVQYAPVHTAAQSNGMNKPFERSTTPFTDNTSSMYGGYPSSTYYYGGFNGASVNDWDRYTNPNGVEMPPGIYGDYQNSYGYAPYGSYSSSGAPMGHDSQLYVPQHYQYPKSYFPPSPASSGPYTHSRANTTQADVTTIAADQAQLSTGAVKGNQSSLGNVFNNRTNISKPLRPNYQNHSLKLNDFYGYGGVPSVSSGNSSIFSFGNNFPSGRNQNAPHLMGLQHQQVGMDQAGFVSRMYPSNRMYGQYPSYFRSGPGYISNNYGFRTNGSGWFSVDNKYKSRGHSSSVLVYENGSLDGLNELNKGPRGKGFKDLKDSEPITLAVKGQSLPLKGKFDEDNLPVFPDREQYNRDDFPETHSDAKFFIIKSYSEDDVHKSIKYGLWASTPNGNKKLDAAYKEAQEKCGGCPVFLLFSVNASGQFVGLAEMVGPVDFDRSVEYWQQDKWTGCFPVKWHIVKDVSNSMLRHITLENNENKPVTNSRDTQEVKFEQGIEIIKIFKVHPSKTCILDDFEFYEGRQRTMQERKGKHKQFNKQRVWDTALPENTDKVGLSSAVTEDDSSSPAGPGVVETS